MKLELGVKRISVEKNSNPRVHVSLTKDKLYVTTLTLPIAVTEIPIGKWSQVSKVTIEFVDDVEVVKDVGAGT